MIFWTGIGWAPLILFLVTVFVPQGLHKEFPFLSSSPFWELSGITVNLLGCWFLGRNANAGLPRRIFDFGLNGPVGHTCGFLRVEYCGFVSAGFFVYSLIQRGF